MNGKTTSSTGGMRNTKTLATIGMLSAVGVILSALIEVPLLPAAPFLLYNPADIPILVGTMIYGPAAGVVMTGIVSLFQSLLRGSGQVIGFVMHFVATGSMALATGLIYRKGGGGRGAAAVSLFIGALVMTMAMVGMNLLLTPIFMNTPLEAVKKMLLPVIIPFNLIKAAINCGASFLLYRRVEQIVRREK